MFGRDKRKDEKPGECCGGACGGHCGDAAPETGAAAGDDAAAQVERLTQQLDEMNTKYLRTVADYQNSARRSAKDAGEAHAQGKKSVVLNVLPVLDHFDLALSQDATKVSAEQIVSGVKVIRDELMKVLQGQGVEVIAPAPNDEFDPHWHQAVTQQQAEGIEPGRIVATLQAGYRLDDRVVRPAMVSVKPAEG